MLSLSAIKKVVTIQLLKKTETEEERPEILNPHNTEIDKNKPFYQGTVLETLDAGGYTYIKVKENLDDHVHKDCKDSHKEFFWIVVERTAANTGDMIRFQKELVTKNYKSEILDKTFDELMFASNLQRKIAE